MVAETSYQMLEFYHFATGRGLNPLSSIKITVPAFLVKKNSPMKLPVVSIFESTRENVKSNLVLVVVLIL